MAIKSSIYFTYDGQVSSDYGVMNVNVSQGLFEEPFLSGRTIHEVKVRGRYTPFFQDIEYAPLTLNVTFSMPDPFNSDTLRGITRWLSTDYYKPLVFSDNMDAIFYALLVDEPTLVHNGQSGYVNLKFRCDGPFAYSPSYSQIYDLSSNISGGTNITFNNIGDLSVFPKLYIQNFGANNTIQIYNQSNKNILFQFTGLNDQENLFINNETKYISTDQNNIYRYSAFNMNWLEILVGNNTLNVVGTCKLKFVWECKLTQW